MRLHILIACACLAGCATPQVGPKPDTAPVTKSNAATRASIKQTRTHIKEAQDKENASLSALEKADKNLSKLLGK
jgi:hypothetical protein